jgi:NADH-quinone oxidoreductase subunit E
MILDRDASKLAKHFRLKKTLCISALGKYYKMERTQDKQVINITEPLMNRINELISHYLPIKENQHYCPFYMKFKMLMKLSTELMDKVAEIIQVLPIEVKGVVYTMYNQNQSVSICLNFVKHHPVASTERRT